MRTIKWAGAALGGTETHAAFLPILPHGNFHAACGCDLGGFDGVQRPLEEKLKKVQTVT